MSSVTVRGVLSLQATNTVDLGPTVGGCPVQRGCPGFRGVLQEGFHCITIYIKTTLN